LLNRGEKSLRADKRRGDGEKRTLWEGGRPCHGFGVRGAGGGDAGTRAWGGGILSSIGLGLLGRGLCCCCTGETFLPVKVVLFAKRKTYCGGEGI